MIAWWRCIKEARCQHARRNLGTDAFCSRSARLVVHHQLSREYVRFQELHIAGSRPGECWELGCVCDSGSNRPHAVCHVSVAARSNCSEVEGGMATSPVQAVQDPGMTSSSGKAADGINSAPLIIKASSGTGEMLLARIRLDEAVGWANLHGQHPWNKHTTDFNRPLNNNNYHDNLFCSRSCRLRLFLR